MQKVSTLKGGGVADEKFYPVLRGGGGEGRKKFRTRFSHFVAPLPVINDQSLTF